MTGGPGERIDRAVRATPGFSGVVLAARGGKIELLRGYGYADRARRIRNTPQTRFRVTWLADQFTAVGLLQLEASGRVDLDASVCEWIPRCPAAWRGTTVDEILRYKARLALPRHGPDDRSLAAWVAAMRGLRFQTYPKSDARGSELVLQYVLERASGLSWERYVSSHIWRRAHMSATGLGGPSSIGYSGETPVPGIDATRTPSRSDGVVSTAGDFYRYLRALADGTLLPRGQFARMVELVPGSYISGYYGVWRYGWLVSRQPQRADGHLFAGQNAHGERGWDTAIAFYPDDDAVFVVFENRSHAPFELIQVASDALLGG